MEASGRTWWRLSKLTLSRQITCKGSVDTVGQFSQVRQLVVADVLVTRCQSFGIDATALDKGSSNDGSCVDFSVTHVQRSVITIPGTPIALRPTPTRRTLIKRLQSELDPIRWISSEGV